MEKLNVLIQSSDFYAPFAGVTLTSLFENNKDIEEITVYLITSDMSEKNKDRFNELFKKYNRVIKYLDATELSKMLEAEGCAKWHGSYTPYYKYFALSLIDDQIEKLLYLDSDLVVNGSIINLVNQDLNNNIMAMAYEVASVTHKRLIKCGKDYYNSGVIVFDVKKWYSEKCIDKFLNHLNNVHGHYPIIEQDIINIILNDKIQILPMKYNFNTDALLYKDLTFMRKTFGFDKYYSNEEFEKTLVEPVVYHCFGSITERPWVKGNDHPIREVWQFYLSISPWSDFTGIESKTPFAFRVQRALFKILPKKLYAFVYRKITDFLQYRRAKKCGLI